MHRTDQNATSRGGEFIENAHPDAHGNLESDSRVADTEAKNDEGEHTKLAF